MERRLITEDQPVHSSCHHQPVFPGSWNRSHNASLCLWVSVAAESAIDMDGDEGSSEELARQLFRYV
jgi:hypothetical protein